jgi:hypothetical protein
VRTQAQSGRVRWQRRHKGLARVVSDAARLPSGHSVCGGWLDWSSFSSFLPFEGPMRTNASRFGRPRHSSSAPRTRAGLCGRVKGTSGKRAVVGSQSPTTWSDVRVSAELKRKGTAHERASIWAKGATRRESATRVWWRDPVTPRGRRGSDRGYPDGERAVDLAAVRLHSPFATLAGDSYPGRSTREGARCPCWCARSTTSWTTSLTSLRWRPATRHRIGYTFRSGLTWPRALRSATCRSVVSTSHRACECVGHLRVGSDRDGRESPVGPFQQGE